MSRVYDSWRISVVGRCFLWWRPYCVGKAGRTVPCDHRSTRREAMNTKKDYLQRISYYCWSCAVHVGQSTCSPLLSISHFRGRTLRSKFLIKMVRLRDTGWKHDGQRQLSRSQTVGYLNCEGGSGETSDWNMFEVNNPTCARRRFQKERWR